MAHRAPGIETLAVHAGARPDPETGARVTPIYQTTAFVFDDAEHAASLFGLKAFGNIYSRITNPTNAVLEERVAALEGGTAALAVASGHAAQFLIFHTLMQPGDNFVSSNKLYGGSINQFGQSFKSFDWQVRWADGTDPAAFEAQIDGRTCAIFVESIADPGGIITDIEAIAKIAHRHGLPLIVDNTLASPYLIRPSTMVLISLYILQRSSLAAMAIPWVASSSIAVLSIGRNPVNIRCCRSRVPNIIGWYCTKPSAISPLP